MRCALAGAVLANKFGGMLTRTNPSLRIATDRRSRSRESAGLLGGVNHRSACGCAPEQGWIRTASPHERQKKRAMTMWIRRVGRCCRLAGRGCRHEGSSVGFSSPQGGWAVGMGQCGGQSRDQDVEAAFEFGGAVIRRQHGCETTQQRELADR